MVSRWQRMVIIRSGQLEAAFPRLKEERLDERGEDIRGSEREERVESREEESEAERENEVDDVEDVDEPEESWSHSGSPGLGSRCRV